MARGRKDKGYLVNYTDGALGHDLLKHGCHEADFVRCKQRVPCEDHLSFHPLPLPAWCVDLGRAHELTMEEKEGIGRNRERMRVHSPH